MGNPWGYLISRIGRAVRENGGLLVLFIGRNLEDQSDVYINAEKSRGDGSKDKADETGKLVILR